MGGRRALAGSSGAAGPGNGSASFRKSFLRSKAEAFLNQNRWADDGKDPRYREPPPTPLAASTPSLRSLTHPCSSRLPLVGFFSGPCMDARALFPTRFGATRSLSLAEMSVGGGLSLRCQCPTAYSSAAGCCRLVFVQGRPGPRRRVTRGISDSRCRSGGGSAHEDPQHQVRTKGREGWLGGPRRDRPTLDMFDDEGRPEHRRDVMGFETSRPPDDPVQPTS